MTAIIIIITKVESNRSNKLIHLPFCDCAMKFSKNINKDQENSSLYTWRSVSDMRVGVSMFFPVQNLCALPLLHEGMNLAWLQFPKLTVSS